MLDKTTIEKVKKETSLKLPGLVKDDLARVILFGSCARGDYTEDSDIDIAVIIKGDREKVRTYVKPLVSLSVDMDLREMVVVNFLCLSDDEYEKKKEFYPFYANIEKDGVLLYG